MKLRKYLLFIVLFFFISSMSISDAQELIAVDESEDADFSSYASYNWMPAVNHPSSEDYISDRSLKLAIQQTIDDELGAMGYVRSSSNPDFLVSYRVVKEDLDPLHPGEPDKTQKIENLPQSQEFDEGTLIIRLLDRNKSTVLWQGYATGILKGHDFLSHTPSRNEGAINNEPQNKEQLRDGGVSSNENDGPSPDERAVEAIRKIFEKFEYKAAND